MDGEHYHEDLHFLIADLSLKLMDLTEAHNKLVDLFRETVNGLVELPCQKIEKTKETTSG